MSMQEPEIQAPAPKPKPKKRRKYKRRAVRKAAEAKPEHSPYEGLGPTSCCNACKPNRCVITQADMCGRTPLQGHFASDPGCIQRRNEARAYLQHQAVDKKNKL